MKKKPKDDKHLSRKQLLQAARDPGCVSEHLNECQSCSEAVALLRSFPVAGKESLQDAPQALIDRAIAVAQNLPAAKGSPRRLADIIFDSWLIPQPVGVRGIESLDHRRLRFDAAGIRIDLRAERLKTEWEFIARISGLGRKDIGPRLLVGKKSVFSDPRGFYLWKSKRPPKKLILHIGGSVIELPELSWKKPRST